MKTSETESNLDTHFKFIDPVCDFRYLNDLVNGKNNLINEILNVFLKQVPEDLKCINEAIAKSDYKAIKIYAHTMKSSVSIMGISILKPVLVEMEYLGETQTGLERIKQLNISLNLTCNHAIEEVTKEKKNYLEA